MRWLVTGFEPFGTYDLNPSARLVVALGGDAIGAVLPVSFERARQRVEELIERHEPDAALLLGLAAERPGVSFELRAHNRSNALAPDNDGMRADEGAIVMGSEEVLPASLPIDLVRSAFADAGVALAISGDAGGYVCNHTFYSALHFARTRGAPRYVGFLHVPKLEPGSPDFGAVLAALRRLVARSIAEER